MTMRGGRRRQPRSSPRRHPLVNTFVFWPKEATPEQVERFAAEVVCR